MPSTCPGGGCVSRILLFLLSLALVACGAAVDDGGGSTTTSTSAPTTTAAPDIAPTSTLATTTTSQVDAGAILDDAVAATGDNYRFVSTVTVDATVVTSIEGVVDGPSVQSDITTGETTISYVRTPEGEWTREGDEEWVRLEGTPPVDPPLTPLTDPKEVVLIGEDGAITQVSGLLGESAGPAAGVEFSASILDGLISEITYETGSNGQTAKVITTLTEVGSAGTVEAPGTGG